LILAAASPVLKKIFDENPETSKVKLQKISPEIFQIVLDVMYGEEMPYFAFEYQLLKDIIYAAHKLKFYDLKQFSMEKLAKQVDEENAVELLVFANKNRCEILEEMYKTQVSHQRF